VEQPVKADIHPPLVDGHICRASKGNSPIARTRNAMSKSTFRPTADDRPSLWMNRTASAWAFSISMPWA